MSILQLLVYGFIAGLIGAYGMNLSLNWLSSSFDEPVNMNKVIGSFFAQTSKKALPIGSLIHLTVGSITGVLYAFLLNAIGVLHFPAGLFTGFGLGFAHGLILTYALMFINDENQPVRKYKKSTLGIGFLYLHAHILYGGIVGTVLSLLALL